MNKRDALIIAQSTTKSTTSIIREAEEAVNGSYAFALVWLDAQIRRYPNATRAKSTLKLRHSQNPGTHFRVDRGAIEFYTPGNAPPTPTTRLPRATERFIDPEATIDPRVTVRTVRGRSGPRHAFLVPGSPTQHRSEAAALRALGACA